MLRYSWLPDKPAFGGILSEIVFLRFYKAWRRGRQNNAVTQLETGI